MAKIDSTLKNLRVNAKGVISRMEEVIAIVESFGGSDDLMSLEHAYRFAERDCLDAVHKIMNAYDDLEEEE